MVAAPIYIPINGVRGFPFLHTLSSIYYLYILWWWPPNIVLGSESGAFELNLEKTN